MGDSIQSEFKPLLRLESAPFDNTVNVRNRNVLNYVNYCDVPLRFSIQDLKYFMYVALKIEHIELLRRMDVFQCYLKICNRSQLYHVSKVEHSLYLEEVIENTCDTNLQVLFYFTRVRSSDTFHLSFYFSAEGTWTSVYSHWTPTLPTT